MILFRYVAKERKFDKNGSTLVVMRTRLPVASPSPSAAVRRVVREQECVIARFAHYCAGKLLIVAERERKTCEKADRAFCPIIAKLEGSVTRSDSAVYSVVYDVSVRLPDGTELCSRAADMRSASDGFPLTLDAFCENPKKLLKSLRAEARRQLDVRARFDALIKPHKLSRKLRADRLALTEDGFEFVKPNPPVLLHMESNVLP